MSPDGSGRNSPAEGFPRVSGDEPSVLIGASESPMFSPRERG